MMNNKIFGAVIALVMIAVLCCACASTTDAFKNSSVACDPGASSVLTLSHSTLVLPLDGTLGRLYAFHADKPLELQWRTENSAVAEVSMGIITPVSAGTTVVTCTDGVTTASCTVIVNADMDTDYSLQLPNRALALAVGDTGEVAYTYTGSGAITMFSNNPQVLQVENGNYTALSPGTAAITCTDGIQNVQCIVTVTKSSPRA